MRFEVPQFIEFEDKIFGPFTFKQFLYLLGGAGAVFIANRFTQNLFWAIIFSSPIIIISLMLVFYKVNGQNFSVILQAAIGYFFRQKLYVWKETKKKPSDKKQEQNKIPQQIEVKKIDKESRIKDVAWGLDVLDKKDY